MVKNVKSFLILTIFLAVNLIYFLTDLFQSGHENDSLYTAGLDTTPLPNISVTTQNATNKPKPKKYNPYRDIDEKLRNMEFFEEMMVQASIPIQTIVLAKDGLFGRLNQVVAKTRYNKGPGHPSGEPVFPGIFQEGKFVSAKPLNSSLNSRRHSSGLLQTFSRQPQSISLQLRHLQQSDQHCHFQFLLQPPIQNQKRTRKIYRR